MQEYPEIKKIYEDIKKLNIQGATNVCIATFEGMKRYLEITKEGDNNKLYEEFFEVGNTLSRVRENEPMARNGVTYVKYFFKKEFSVLPEVNSMKRRLYELCDEYLDMIGTSKKELLDFGTKNLFNFDKVFTHCHSSTAVSLIKSIGKNDKNFEVVCTETRPLFQGRKTARSLVEAGIKTTLIADSAAESFVIGRGSVPVDVVFIGCDQITGGGHAINKIGSWGIGMAAHYADKPLYVVCPLLKLDEETNIDSVEIEVREDRELWDDAPNGLDLYNPAFEILDSTLITGYVTEVGIVKPSDIEKEAKIKYPWLIEKV